MRQENANFFLLNRSCITKNLLAFHAAILYDCPCL